MKKWFLSLLLFPLAAFGQYGAVQNQCVQGGTPAVTSGQKSSNYLNGIVPRCTITVYLTGTSTKATIYSDPGGDTLSNPFYANAAYSTNPGGWIFWAATNVGLDVVMSGGDPPNTYSSPVTLTDVFPSSSFNPVTGVTAIVPGNNVTCSTESGGSCAGGVTVNAIVPFTSLTTTGTSGESTLSDGVLNVPEYQGALTLTTSGSSGAATLSGNTLNIPEYQGALTLTTTGTSGAATYSSGTLNVPEYQGALTLTTTGSSGAATLSGNTLNIPEYSGGSGGGLNGTVTYTSSQTASTSDAGKLVVMNCSSACAYTLPATQPSTTWNVWLVSMGSTLATVALGGSDTFNGSSSVPVLNSFRVVPIWANSATSTAYDGDAPLKAGTNVTLTPASNGLTLAASGGGGGSTDTRPTETSTPAEYVTIGPNSSYEFSTSPTSPSTAGTLVDIHITLGNSADAYTISQKSKLEITCDGDTETVTLGMFFPAMDQPLPWVTDWLGVTLGQTGVAANASMNRRVEIDYSSGCSLTFVNASSVGTITFFGTAQYRVGTNVSRSSRQHWRAVDQPPTYVAQYGTFAALPQTGDAGGGELESQTLWVNSINNYGYFDGNPVVTVDGGSEGVTDGGIEDYFGCGYDCINGVGGIHTSKWGQFYATGIDSTVPGLQTPAYEYDDLLYRLFQTADSDNVIFTSSLAASYANGESGQGTAPGTVYMRALTTYWTHDPPAQPVTFSPAGAQLSLPQTVTLSTTTSGATICYTTDGSAPVGNGDGSCSHGTSGSSVTVSSGETISAIATESGYADSTIASQIYAASQTFGYVTGTSTIGSSGGAATVTSNAITFSAGDHALIFCRVGAVGGGYTNVQSSAGGDLIVGIGQASSTSGIAQLFYVDQTVAGSTTFTCSSTTSEPYPGIAVLQYHAGTTHTYPILGGALSSTSSPTTGSFSTTAAGTIVVCMDPAYGAGTLAAGTIGGSSATLRLATDTLNCEDVAKGSAQSGITGSMSAGSAGVWEYGVVTFQ